MNKQGTRSYDYTLEIMSKVEIFQLALKEAGFKSIWQFWGILTPGVNCVERKKQINKEKQDSIAKAT